MPTAAIGADVMVGFPGETDEQFEETRRFHRIAAVHLSARVYLFAAARDAFGHDAGAGPRRRHARAKTDICGNWRQGRSGEFQEQFIGRELEAITLTNFENGRTEGLTDNYQKLWIEGTV